jgi:DNA-binding GntR family transcriptional regulator
VQAIEEHASASPAAAKRQDKPAFHAVDRALHLEIAQASGNSRLAQSIRDALDLTSALRSRDALDIQSSLACANCHIEIAAAIRQGAHDVAAALIRRHLQAVQELVVAGFVRDSPAADI